MVLYTDFPFLWGENPPHPLQQLAVHVVDEALGASPCIDPGKDRMTDQLVQHRWLGYLPDDGALLARLLHGEQRVRVAIRQGQLPDTRRVAKLLEHRPDGLLNTLVGVHHELVICVVDVTRRKENLELSACGLGFDARTEPGLHVGEFKFGDRALDLQHQAVVGDGDVINLLQVCDQGVEVATHLEQVSPVPGVTREPRGFDAKYDAGLAQGDLSQQPLESRSVCEATRRDPLVVFDESWIGPAKGDRLLAEAALESCALGVLADLLRIRLADIDDGAPLEMPRSNAMLVSRIHGAPPVPAVPLP